MDLTTAGRDTYNFYAAIVPKKMTEEVMAVYAMRPGVQQTGALERWTLTPGEGEVKRYTILTTSSGGRGPGTLATRLLRRTLGDFTTHRGMSWGWWQIEYHNTGLKHGVECRGEYAPSTREDIPASCLMEYLADKFSVSIYINGL